MIVSSSLLAIAIQTVNSASARHAHQEKEPMSLKKFEKLRQYCLVLNK